MSVNEIFPNPTLKQVIFQIRFSNLFSIENKIGDLQLKIMEEFPHSALVFRRQVVFVDAGPNAKLEDVAKGLGDTSSKKVWQFKSDKDVQLNVLSDSLDITSQHHKTYNLGEGDKFRDTIKFVLKNFFKVIPILEIERVGLRYIDECPVPTKDGFIDDAKFKSYYNSSFPLRRFKLSKVNEINFKAVVRKGKYNLRYSEFLTKNKKGEYKLILDFDGFTNNILKKDYLKVTDKLHEITSAEYKKTIKEPVYEYMRHKKEG